jgi:preprotein translocase subunit SecD
MRDRYLRIALILILIGIGIWVNLPNSSDIKVGKFERSRDITLGLDLQGGLQVLLEVPQNFDVTGQDLDVARQILENRSNGLGVSEVVFQVAGSRRIVGEFPGLTDTTEVVDVLKTTGQLEFVDLGSTYLPAGTPIKTDLGQTTSETVTPEVTPTSEVATSEDNLLQDAAPTDAAQAAEDTVWHTIMTGDQLKTVQVETDTVTNDYLIYFELKDEGAAVFADYTSKNVGSYLAIVLDGKVISAPVIENPITKGQGSISGSFTYDTANNLAVQLRYGSLPIPLEEVETRVIGPTLGQDSLDKSLVAGIVGFVIITLFMLIYYRLPGGIAVLAIIIYGLITLTIYKLIPVTLTLPGIAGFLLSTGGALDANILIFERLKEELRGGRNLSQAVEMGWKRAWPSIRDSNAATLITSLILFLFGSSYGASAVKGFALTLAIGVFISVFGALVVTRTFMSEILNALKITNLKRWFGI